MLEQRKSTRRRTLLDGRIEVEKLNGWAVDCAVRNIGDGGARIALPDHAIVPSTFRLGISGGAPKPARLVWYKEGQAGVALCERREVAPARWDGVCRRSPRPSAAVAPSRQSTLQARIDTITARPAGDRRASR